MSEETPSRRARYRRQTIEEIKAIALAQVSDGGPASVSLNGIARTMGMSPGALYRYFDNRDDLLTDLVVDAYNDLGDHLERAASAVATGEDSAPIRVATAYRQWALKAPNVYRLIFETTSGSGSEVAPERVIPAAQRGMDVFLAALLGADPSPGWSADRPRALADQLLAWGRRGHHDDVPVGLLHESLVLWSRVHGLVSLEIGQHLGATGVSPELLFAAELEHLRRPSARS